MWFQLCNGQPALTMEINKKWTQIAKNYKHLKIVKITKTQVLFYLQIIDQKEHKNRRYKFERSTWSFLCPSSVRVSQNEAVLGKLCSLAAILRNNLLDTSSLLGHCNYARSVIKYQGSHLKSQINDRLVCCPDAQCPHTLPIRSYLSHCLFIKEYFGAKLKYASQVSTHVQSRAKSTAEEGSASKEQTLLILQISNVNITKAAFHIELALLRLQCLFL